MVLQSSLARKYYYLPGTNDLAYFVAALVERKKTVFLVFVLLFRKCYKKILGVDVKKKVSFFLTNKLKQAIVFVLA